MIHDDYEEMLALHALGALEAREASELESHLRTCGACSAELIELRNAAGELAHAVEPVVPPAELTERILEMTRPRVETTPSTRPSQLSPAASFRRLRDSRWWRRTVIVGRIAAAAAVVILVISQINLLNRLDETLFLLARGREMFEFIASPDVSTIPLGGTEIARDARALLAIDRRTGRVIFLAFNLPPPPRGMAYQLWFIDDGISPGGVFSPDAIGSTMLHDQWSAGGRKPSVFAVSVEPSSGVPSPTGRFVLQSAAWTPPQALRSADK